ncbi:IS3 family transposase [Chromobacterium amazonense]|uniref:IS3 family transposase n=2 Tax=Chromobacterium amazonense TaxID=1382803 RepID=UPI0031F67AC4
MYKIPRQSYTAEFKQEAVRQVESEGKPQAQVARELGIAEQTLANWRKAHKAGKLTGGTGKPITPEQMELSRLRAENARLRMELEILGKSDGVLREEVAVKYAWIDRVRDAYPLQSLCRLLSVSTSGFANWKGCGGPALWLSNAQVLALIRSIHAEFNGAYGSPRIYQELKSRGFPVSKARIHRLMTLHGIRARHKRRYKATTNSKHALPVAPNLLNRQFDVAAPDQVWTTDITYIPTREGWLYLAVVMDLYSRVIVGWAMDGRMTRELVMDALRMARFRRKPAPGLLHHSDRGSQYCSHDYQALLAEYGMRASMSRKGNCWDNAPMESFFNSLKNERVFHEDYATRAEATQDLFEYIEVFYNRKRRHSSLGYRTPEQQYAAWFEAAGKAA